jgi:hypothetical protein
MSRFLISSSSTRTSTNCIWRSATSPRRLAPSLRSGPVFCVSSERHQIVCQFFGTVYYCCHFFRISVEHCFNVDRRRTASTAPVDASYCASAPAPLTKAALTSTPLVECCQRIGQIFTTGANVTVTGTTAALCNTSSWTKTTSQSASQPREHPLETNTIALQNPTNSIMHLLCTNRRHCFFTTESKSSARSTYC